MSKKIEKYQAKLNPDIAKLDWREHVRMRPGMYIGNMQAKGFANTITSILGSIFKRTEADTATVKFALDKAATLIFENVKKPIDDSFGEDNPNHHNGNFEHYYLPLLNALSSYFKIETWQNDELLSQLIYEKGFLKKGEISNKKINGDRIEINFELDKTLWRKDLEWNIDFFIEEIRTYAYFFKHKKFRIQYEVDGEPCQVVFKFKNGVQDKLDLAKLKGLGSTYFDTYFEKDFDGFSVEIAFAFRRYTVDEGYLVSYVNDRYTQDYGTHVDGLLTGLTYGVMKYFQKHELTEQYKISEKGMKEHLVAVVNVRMKSAVFVGCVKNKLGNPEIIEPMANYIADLLFDKIENDEEGTKLLIQKFRIN